MFSEEPIWKGTTGSHLKDIRKEHGTLLSKALIDSWMKWKVK